MRKRTQFLVTLLTIASTVASGQSPSGGAGPSAAELQRAAAAFNNADWPATRAAYQAIATAHPQHALSRFRIGVALMELGDLDAAERDLRHGEKLGIAAPQAA